MTITTASECWILTDGKVGTEKPCRAIAHDKGYLNPRLIRLKARWPWRYLPARWWPESLITVENADLIATPPPRLIIAATRVAVKPALALKRRYGPTTQVIFWQDPRSHHQRFDQIIAPAHDGLVGPNVITVPWPPSLITPLLIAEAAAKYQAPLEGPYVTVLLGGPNKYTRYPVALGPQVALWLREAFPHHGFLITASRRTPALFMEAFQTAMEGHQAYLWNGEGMNPYEAFLGLADHILVTSDSVSMIADAIATDKPVTILNLAVKPSKFDRLYSAAQEHGCALISLNQKGEGALL